METSVLDAPLIVDPSKGTTLGEGNPVEDRQLATTAELFQFAEPFDYLCMFAGMVGAFGTGAAQPAIMFIFGDVLDAASSDIIGNTLQKTFDDIAIKMCVAGAIVFVSSWVGEAGFKASGMRQTAKVRGKAIISLR
jgi:hypothetical protein